MAQHPVPQNPKKKVKKNSGKKVSKETRKCFFCKNKGHLRADCFGWKALQEKKGSESEKRGDGNIGKVATPMKLGGLDTNELSVWVRLEIQPGKYLDLQGVRYAPNGAVNLISQRLLEKTRWKPSYFGTYNEQLRCKYFDKDGIRLVFTKKDDGFYWTKASPVLQTSMMVARSIETLEDNIVMKWHLKLAHLNEEAMKKMVRDGLADGMDGMTMDNFKKTPLKCMACEEAKAKRMAFKRQVGKRASECGARLMSDVCYVGIVTPGRAKYFQLVQDEASRYKWVFLLNKKSEAAENVIVLVRQLEKDYKVNLFSCDQGGEFLNHMLATFFREHGIRLLTINAYTPEEIAW
ncbi:Integrase, catalytic core protein [Phytophthora cinnamomi]|uniref:Integrase, catalytic core protein n=1 Tax=Phytophthora cinnamomi TaxID=4785 RepID=UPI00355A21C3|nr:Integrase, catalytic core protein [Phytophthora cinnamomi]